MSKIRLFILAISISAAVYANYDTGYSGENGYTGYETEVYDQPAFSGGKSQGTGANGAASSGSRGGSYTLIDQGLGVAKGIYSYLPSTYQMSGYTVTDRSTGTSADNFVVLAGPNGRMKVETQPIFVMNGDTNQFFEYAEMSVRVGLQKTGNDGYVSSEWQQSASGQLSFMVAEFAGSNGRIGSIYLRYLNSGGMLIGYPSVFLFNRSDENEFFADLGKINDGYQANPQWAVARNNASRQGLAVSRAQHQNNMASLKASFDASQKTHRSSVDSFDQANAAWSDNFNKSKPSATSSDSSYSRLISTINETENYSDPSSSNDRTLSAGYRHTYTNGQGEYHQTNDNFFNPMSLGGNWTRIEQK